jgi:MoxR-like ATPase
MSNEHHKINQALAVISQQLLGKEQQIKLAVSCLLAQGHLLIEDLPGMGKTTLAHALAHVFDLEFKRVQFTSDLLPADITGTTIFDVEQQQFRLHRGAIFSQLLLADEINRASPKTQSALLEAMEEGQVSIDGESYRLPTPFFVIATQNPQHHAGTYPLPESQLDRFMMRLTLGFPSTEAELAILKQQQQPIEAEQALSRADLLKIQQQVAKVYCADEVLQYVLRLLTASRQPEFAGNPLSPRSGLALVAAARAWAFIAKRDHVLPDDIQAVFEAVCLHRLQPFMVTEQPTNLSQQLLNDVAVLA